MSVNHILFLLYTLLSTLSVCLITDATAAGFNFLFSRPLSNRFPASQQIKTVLMLSLIFYIVGLSPCLFLATIKERYEEIFGYQYMCNSPAAPSRQSSISDPFSWAIIHSPRPILRLIRWCSIRRVLWWPEQSSSAKSFHLTHPMWLWYMRMTYRCSDAQGGSGNAKSSKKNAQSTRLGELHIWGTPPLTRSFIMAENRQGALSNRSSASKQIKTVLMLPLKHNTFDRLNSMHWLFASW